MERVNKINAAWVVAFIAIAAIAVALGIVFGDKKSDTKSTTSTLPKSESSTKPPMAPPLPALPVQGYSSVREGATLSDVAMNGGLTCDSTCTGCQAGGPWKSIGCMENVSPAACKAWETELPNSWKLCDGSPPPPPPNPEAPKNCVLTEYGDWGPCDKACGEGTQTRTRTIIQQAKNGGQACPDTLTQTRSCTGTSCPTQTPTTCEVSDWNKLGACSKTCGDGTMQWTRSIIKPGSGSGPGSTCPPLTETHSCNLGPCPTATTAPTPSHSTKDPYCSCLVCY